MNVTRTNETDGNEMDSILDTILDRTDSDEKRVRERRGMGKVEILESNYLRIAGCVWIADVHGPNEQINENN